MSTGYTITQAPVTLETADPAAKPLLQSAQDALGFVPQMYRHMAKVPGVLSTYMHGYQQFRENSGLTPAEQEVVFLTISRENGCGYCMGAHSMLADKVSGVPTDTLQALRDGGEIPDAKLQALSTFTRVMFRSRGRPKTDDVQAFLDAGFEEAHVMQIVLALAVKTLSNYSNHVNRPELDEAFAGHRWQG